MSDIRTDIASINGFKVAGVHCGLKKADKLDFALIVSDAPCATAGVFTTNQVKAAPVLVNMERLQRHADSIRAVAVNTGSANACTGQTGMDNAYATATFVAEKLGIKPEQVLVLSTGVIGTQLPMDKIRNGIEQSVGQLGDDWDATAQAIMTTDTRPKTASVSVTTASGAAYAIAGIVKGAGMIAPNMATMLSVIVTDTKLDTATLQQALRTANDVSFNQIVVDGDTSTNDTVLLLANGVSGADISTPDDLAQFTEALTALSVKLAQDVVRDGEGATKFITINVTHAQSRDAARQIANTIANSPLVKTAFYGNDANWGRIFMAAGRAGITLDPMKLTLTIGAGESPTETLTLVEHGTPTDYSEEAATAIISEQAFTVTLDCGYAVNGSGAGHAATVWTCDLSHEYVSINGDYRS
jgi:glutamate N-acetyltransferase/amino-acid N-acetyltransferase